MTANAAANTPVRKSRSLKLGLAFLLIIAAGLALAWIGAGSLRPEVTPSGLVFRTVAAGTGEPLTRQDVALVEYEGRLDDGTVFDSSANQGGPQAMSPQGMIPGFAEAMLRMREGGHYRFKLPPKLAYGDQPPPGLPAGAHLNFDVKILKVARGAANMMQQMQGAQGAPGGTPPPQR